MLHICENGLHLSFVLEPGKAPAWVHFGRVPFQGPLPENLYFYGIQEVQAAGESALWHVGLTTAGTLPGSRMAYTGHRDTRNVCGRLLEIDTFDEKTGLAGTMEYQFFDGVPVIRCRNRLQNRGKESVGLEVVSSLVLPRAAEIGEDPGLLIPHNSWQQELQWEETPLSRLGSRFFVHNTSSSKRIQIRSIGSWSSGEYVPLACLRRENDSLFWQIEHNGSWNWELLEHGNKYSLAVTGPNHTDHHWFRELEPGAEFVPVPVSFGLAEGEPENAFRALNQYRRVIRRPNTDNRNLPIIFNDYMNCLWAEPTTEKEIPIIDAAAALGCEVYCIDAGWYTDDANWFSTIGQWEPSQVRFPGGLKEVTDRIREKGMIPGLWLEIEYMGVNCPLVPKVDKSWFFHRNGRITNYRGRYQLDFRNPEVRAYTRGVIDRLIRDFGVGYFKIDYNYNSYAGTDLNSHSLGDGLLEHNRAYLGWLDEIFRDYPDLILENCSSGGMRTDYAMLSRHSLASCSDQEDFRKFPSIVANSPTALTPEQAAVWSYPLEKADREEIIFNCVSSSLCRIHQSGNTATLPESHKALIRQQYANYRGYRQQLPQALPFWPLGLAREGDPWICLGMEFSDCLRLALWRLGGDDTVHLPLPQFRGKALCPKVAFPAGDTRCRLTWNPDTAILTATLPEPTMARLIEIPIQPLTE